MFSAFFAVKISLVMNSTVNGYVFPTGQTGLTELTDFNLQLFSFQFSAFQLLSSLSIRPVARPLSNVKGEARAKPFEAPGNRVQDARVQAVNDS